MMALRRTMTPAAIREQQLRAGLDGTFIAVHFTGKYVPIKVPADFNPYSPDGEALINRTIWQKVIEE